MKTITPPQKDGTTDPGSYSWKLLLIKDARVHYVVLKQQPQTTHPTHANVCARCSQETRNTSPTPPPGLLPRKGTPDDAMVLLPQDPTVCQTLNRPYPPRHRSRTTTPKGKDPYWVPGKNRRPLFVDIPPVSTRRRTYVCATGVLLTTPPHRHYAWQGCCRCSLERR